jgi:DNA polymerase III alpha subunit (gram-positive type)
MGSVEDIVLMDRIFLDNETTGLDEHKHRIWEIAGMRRDANTGRASEFVRQINVDSAPKDAKALEISGFHERYRSNEAVSEHQALAEFCEFSKGGVLMLLNPWFDSRFVSALFGRVNCYRGDKPELSATWHYSPVDVKSFVAGVFGIAPPWRSDDLAKVVGVHPEQFERHAALADCYYAEALYDEAYAAAHAGTALVPR